MKQSIQTWNSSKTFREQEFWSGILPQKQRMFGPSKIMKKRMDQSTICWSIHNLRINTKSMDQFTTFGSKHNVWINPKNYVDQSTILGSIHHLWINPMYGSSSNCGSIEKCYWNSSHVDKFTFCCRPGNSGES